MDMSAFRAAAPMNLWELTCCGSKDQTLLGQKGLSLAKQSVWCGQPVFRMRPVKAVRIHQYGHIEIKRPKSTASGWNVNNCRP